MILTLYPSFNVHHGFLAVTPCMLPVHPRCANHGPLFRIPFLHGLTHRRLQPRLMHLCLQATAKNAEDAKAALDYQAS